MTTIHPLSLRLSNAYLLVGDHRPVLVDTGSPGDERRIEEGCATAGVDQRDFALILHTHVHSDHFGTTAHFAALARCPVCYHENDRELAAQGHNGRLRGVGLRGRVMAPFFSRTPFKTVSTDLPAAEGRSLDDLGVSATLLHTPGHTRGSISIVMDDGDAIVGDVLMGGYIGGAFRPGKPNFHYFAEDPGARDAQSGPRAGHDARQTPRGPRRPAGPRRRQPLARGLDRRIAPAATTGWKSTRIRGERPRVHRSA